MKRIKLLIVAIFVITSFLPFSTVSAGSLNATINNQTLTEGQAGLKFTLNLSSKPSGTNTVSVTWQTNYQCLLSHEGRGFVTSGQAITESDKLQFEAKATDDNSQESTHECLVTYKTVSADSNLNNLNYSQRFIINDNNDSPNPDRYFNTSILSANSINEGTGSTYIFAIGPSVPATDKLVISASASDGQCELVANGRGQTYVEQSIPANVLGTAIFTVRAINDADVEGLHGCTIYHSLRTNDLAYSGITISNTQVVINDDEAPYSSEEIKSEYLLNRNEFGFLDALDANNDGKLDQEQPNLAVFINQVNGRRQAVEAIGQDGANCNAISTPTVSAEDQLSKKSNDYHFPHGLYDFKVICDKPGATALINIYLDNFYNTKDISLVKFSKESGYSPIKDFEVGEFAVQAGVVSRISYSIKDGGTLDEDKSPNGTIVDPVGVGLSALEPQSSNPLPINNAQNTSKKPELVIIVLPLVVLTAAVGAVLFKKHRAKQA